MIETLEANIGSFGASFLDFSLTVAFGMLILSFFLTVYRLVRGPSLADRVLSLDFLFTLGMTFIAIFVISSQRFVYLDIAIALGLVGFLATVAYARYVLQRWRLRETAND